MENYHHQDIYFLYFIEIIRKKRLRLVIVGSITIDCRNGEMDAMSSAFLKMAGVFSELELQMIRARVKSGMQNAIAKGKRVGRRLTTKEDIPAVFMKHYPAYVAKQINVSEFARLAKLSRPTVYKYLKMMEYLGEKSPYSDYRQDETNCGGKRLWTCGFHYADWLALDNSVQGSSFGGTDPYYVASAYYYFSADMTARAAKVLGYEADAAFYSKLAEEIKEAFRKEFFTATGRIAEPTQTAMIMALHMGLVPEQFRARLIADLRKKIEAKNWHLDTGFVGTYYICRTLSDNGMADVAYTLLLNEDLPSWLYEVNMGATTVWERWNSVLPNGLVSDTGMNSMNHYAYGSVVEWMYRYMCGINPVEECPGFKKARIAPCPDARFEYVSGSYDSASGLYKSGWKYTEAGIVCTITVPFDCEAEFVLPAEGMWIVNGHPAVIENGVIRLNAGEYELLQK